MFNDFPKTVEVRVDGNLGVLESNPSLPDPKFLTISMF